LFRSQKALDAGVTRVELDLHLSADQQLMVIHDPTLKRTTGLRGKVAQHTAAELTRMDARLGLPGWPTPCPIPTLEQLLQACPQIEHYQLEVKSGSERQSRIVLDAIMALVEHYQLHDKVVVTSASRTLLSYAKRSGFALPTGLVEEYGLLNPLKSARRYGCQYLILNWKLCNAERLRQAQAQGLHVSVWTVNDAARMQQLINMGVDSLITDYPARAMEVSQGRG
ncbi:MAG TPA: glycerophosphodiester phosphodiesterase, partial [Pseudomonas pachastrellae]|nr:glycerophosphodiester phosphodiesterase [Halopseudomonas pachastrellae]